jgi:hypothetical protein
MLCGQSQPWGVQDHREVISCVHIRVLVALSGIVLKLEHVSGLVKKLVSYNAKR